MTRHVRRLTKYQKLVYNIVHNVPRGKVTTYQKVAKVMGNKYLARIVGNALNKNPFPSDKVPCHRVIKSNGSLGGYASEVKVKKRLLLKEGVKFDAKDKINPQYIIKLKK